MKEKKWFLIGHYVEETQQMHYSARFISEEEVTNLTDEEIMYKFIEAHTSIKFGSRNKDQSMEELLLKELRRNYSVEELLPTGEKLRREDLVNARYTEEVVRKYLETISHRS